MTINDRDDVIFIGKVKQKSQDIWKVRVAQCQWFFCFSHPLKLSSIFWRGVWLLTSSSLCVAFSVHSALLLLVSFFGWLLYDISASLYFLSSLPKGWTYLQSVPETWSLSWISAQKPLEMSHVDSLILLRKCVIHT